jgi:hypothetical protein
MGQVGAKMLQEDARTKAQTDRQDEANSCFWQFFECVQKVICHSGLPKTGVPEITPLDMTDG